MTPATTHLTGRAAFRRSAVAGGALAAAGGVTWSALSSTADPTATGMAAAALSALGAGIADIAVSWRRKRAGVAGESARALLGVACTAWGAGQLLLALDAHRTGVRSFGLGDVLGMLAPPLVALAMLRMPRRSRASLPGVRLSLDALILSAALTLAAWWFVLRPALPMAGEVTSGALAAAAEAFFDIAVVVLVALVWVRDRRPGASYLAIGAALQAVADINALPSVVAGAPMPWPSGAIWCLAWPVIGLGVARIDVTGRQSGDSLHEDLGESRSTTIATVMSIVVVIALLIAAPEPHVWTVVDLALLGIVAVLLVGRELLGSSLRRLLVNQIGAEALRDALTGLPNRRALTGRMRSLDLSRPWVLLTVDLDGFKEINDLLGHRAADELIGAVAAVLTGSCPDGSMIARIGGDEFGVLVAGDVAAGERLAEKLTGAVRSAPEAHRVGVPLSVSIGVGRVLAENPEPGPELLAGAVGTVGVAGVAGVAGAGPPTHGTADERRAALLPPVGQMPALLDPRHDRLVALVESAAALRAAKAAGRGRVAVYPGAVEKARERRLVIEWRLREALAAGRLEMYAQPLVDLRTGEVRGFESLARWTDALLGQVSPAEFVPIAEQAGLVTSLGDFALRSTLEEARIAGVLDRTTVEVGVNVSPIQLRLPRFARMVADLLTDLDLPPERLMLEVTEAILVDEDDPAAGTLAELAAVGVRLAIDDFGTGYSALGYLRRLPLDVLKIDRSWVVDSVSDRRTRHIVSGVIDLAHQLGARVVMEGVEDAGIAAMCLELGADIGQGWHFGRPAPWAEAAARPDVVRAAESSS